MDEQPCRISDIGGFNQTLMADRIEAEDDNVLLSCRCVNVCKRIMCPMTPHDQGELASSHEPTPCDVSHASRRRFGPDKTVTVVTFPHLLAKSANHLMLERDPEDCPHRTSPEAYVVRNATTDRGLNRSRTRGPPGAIIRLITSVFLVLNAGSRPRSPLVSSTDGVVRSWVWVSSVQRTDPNGRSSMRRTRPGSGPMWKAMACRSSARSD